MVNSNNLFNNGSNLGIGTADPTEKLDVAGNVKTSGTVTVGAVTYPNTDGSANQVLSTTGTGILAWSTPAKVITEIADEYTDTVGVGSERVTSGKTNFTLSQVPSVNTKVKMYVNGIRISNTAYSVSGSTLTYFSTNNGGYVLTISDRIQFDYFY